MLSLMMLFVQSGKIDSLKLMSQRADSIEKQIESLNQTVFGLQKNLETLPTYVDAMGIFIGVVITLLAIVVGYSVYVAVRMPEDIRTKLAEYEGKFKEQDRQINGYIDKMANDTKKMADYEARIENINREILSLEDIHGDTSRSLNILYRIVAQIAYTSYNYEAYFDLTAQSYKLMIIGQYDDMYVLTDILEDLDFLSRMSINQITYDALEPIWHAITRALLIQTALLNAGSDIEDKAWYQEFEQLIDEMRKIHKSIEDRIETDRPSESES